MLISIMIGLVVVLSLTVPPATLTLVDNGKAVATLIVPAGANAATEAAANELADCLRQIGGAEFRIRPEDKAPANGTRIFVGPTAFAKSKGLAADKLGPEEWVMRTFGSDLVIIGGEPRGTIYGTYHFLEDVLGVHWWNPFETGMPQRKTVQISSLDIHGKPVIQYRDIYMSYGRDGGRFAARNRMDRDGDAKITAQWGGARDYGPPYHAHTFNLYFPPKEYFPTHPEWYSLINGKRVGEFSELCLTNPELRKAFLAKLLNYIETSWAAAKAAGDLRPLVFSVSQNDWRNPCQCINCQAIAKAEESEAGPLLDFVNYLADRVKDKYPEVYIETLAYQYTQKTPKTIKPHDNVIVRLCDTDSDSIQPITSEANEAFREQLMSWVRIAKNLRIWDYAVTYASPVGMPMPTVRTYAPNYRFYAEHSVEGVFEELEFEILADMRDYKVWMIMKLLEDPYADPDALTKIFTDGFYGPAGKLVRQYLTELGNECDKRNTRINLHSTLMSLTYLNLGFVNRAQGLFDQAEKAVGGDMTLLRRVRHARLPLDRASVMAYSRLMSDWIALGKPPAQAPPDRDATGRRALSTWLSEAKLRLPEPAQEIEKQHAEAEMRRYTTITTSVALPEKFRDQPKGTVYDYIATMTRNRAEVKVVEDSEADTGITDKLDLTADYVEGPEKYVLPMRWGLYGTVDKKSVAGNPIEGVDIPGPGYHWYKMGSFPIELGYYAYFFWSWIIQVDVDNVFDPANPGQKFDIWARIKFEGPRFPYAKPGDKDAIYVERLVLAKVR
jgi:hypothetical protein